MRLITGDFRLLAGIQYFSSRGPLVRLLNRATNGGPNARFPFGNGSPDLCYGVIRIRFGLSLLCLRLAGDGI